MRGKREIRRHRDPRLLLLSILSVAEALVIAGLLFFRPLSPDRKAPAEPETGLSEPRQEPQASAAGPAELPTEAKDPKRFVISLLGDCTLSSSHYTNHFESVVGDDLAYPFSNVAELLTADDLTLANLECSFSDKRLESASEYAFCGQTKYAESLVLGGVDCVSMANNHTNDFGSVGVADTAAALEKVGVTGIQGDQSVCFDLRHGDGTALRVGVYVLPFNGSTDQMKKGAARLREDGADIVIACMHAGAEKIYVPTARQTYLAHAAVDGGADVVVGTHPHILQPAEEYGQGVILYSLGNFCFGGNRNPGDKDTVIAQLVADVEESGITWKMEYVPCGVSSVADRNDYRPTPYTPGSESYQRCLDKLASPWNTTTAEEAAAKAAEEQPS